MKFHHLEMLVRNGPKMVRFFTEKLDFKLIASRRTGTLDQWLVSNGSAPLIVTENFAAHASPTKDSIRDLAVQVEDVRQKTDEMKAAGVEVLVQATNDTDESGCSVVRSTISTGFGNIVHTLIEKGSSYRGHFMPGWNNRRAVGNRNASDPMSGTVDHVTYVCRPGETDGIIEWYKRWFGMERFIMNDMDDVRDGLVVGSPIGIRLKAVKAATGGRSLFLVIVEPLTAHDTNHVALFLEKHGGAGIEHVAFATQDIVRSVKEFRNRGVQFRNAPEYGNLTSKKVETKEEENLRSLGILLDREESHGYLYQAFTLPIFNEPTLFLEFIQRKGARAFGAGNITRIMKSIEKQNEEKH